MKSMSVSERGGFVSIRIRIYVIIEELTTIQNHHARRERHCAERRWPTDTKHFPPNARPFSFPSQKGKGTTTHTSTLNVWVLN